MRVFAISIVITIILGTGEIPSIVLIVFLTLFYTFEGGMTAVIWTDVVQMFLYVAGAIISLFVILSHIPGGIAHVWDVASAANKFRIFDFRFEPTAEFFARPYSFWAGILGGTFLTTASHGTEQLMVQRLLAAGSESDSRKALFASWFVILFQFTLFLMIGIILWVYYQDNHLAVPAKLDRVYPQFIWNSLPTPIAGLIMAAILAAAMSNLSAALNALASTTIMDFFKPYSKKIRSEEQYVRLARWTTVAWGGVLFSIALVAQNVKSALESGLSIASIVYGSLLGVFLLGRLTTRVGEKAAMVGMLCGLVLMLYIYGNTKIAFTWYVLIGTTVTMATALLASLVIKEDNIART